MNTPSRQIVAGEVRAAMGRAGVNQSQLAELVGISKTSLSERLAGRLPFTTDHLFLIGQALGVDPLSLMVSPTRETA